MNFKCCLLYCLACLLHPQLKGDEKAKTAFQVNVTHVSDEKAGLEFRMNLCKDADEGVYGIQIEIRNVLSERDFDFIVCRDFEDSFVVLIRDPRAGFLSKIPTDAPKGLDAKQEAPPKKKGGLAVVKIPKASSHEWFLPLVEHLKKPELSQDELKGCWIMVSVNFLSGIPPRVIGLRETKVRLTKKALEGDARKKYEAWKASQKPSTPP